MGKDVGLQGSQSRLAAIACLTSCPLLTDLAEWSHWELVFKPQHGKLRDFVQKYGGQQEVSLEGKYIWNDEFFYQAHLAS